MSTNDPPPARTKREVQEEIRVRIQDVLEILQPARKQLDAKGYPARVEAREEADGRILLTVEVATVPHDTFG